MIRLHALSVLRLAFCTLCAIAFVATPAQAQNNEEGGMMERIDSGAGWLNEIIGSVFFLDIAFWTDAYSIPLVVIWLAAGAVFFTFYMGFVNVRAFGHALQVVRGKYTSPTDDGEVSHFQALATALSATVGLGNIAGVAIAISIGGPGATFWMIIAGLLGMSLKFAEVTLAMQYRSFRADGRVMGGAMEYLSKGLAEKGRPKFGKALAVLFCLLCIGGSFGGGNSFQVNQSMNAVGESVPFFLANPWVYGLIMAGLVGLVIFGGIRRIASVADKVVPIMAVVYVLMALFIIAMRFDQIPWAFGVIFSGAFDPDAALGGIIGVLVVGFQRAAFSNEAGAGSAAIAHAAARSRYPVREGIVALLEPFIDTVVVCTMTALMIVITGAYDNPAFAELRDANMGAALTSGALGTVSSIFPHVLSLAVFLFAFSTMISWSYYGERSWAWLFGDGSSNLYRTLFVTAAFLGSIVTATNVLEFGDLMILGMAFPNILGVFLLRNNIKRAFITYWDALKSGEIKPYDETEEERAAT